MKFIKYLALLVATLAFLAACSTDGGDTSTTTGGTLIVNVQDAVSGAAVTGNIVVTKGGAAVDTATGVSTKTWTGLAAGAYEVAVTGASGYLDSAAQTVNVTDGGTARYNAQMVSASQVTGNVATVSFAFEDELGMAYDTNDEDNDHKEATLIVAQTEEAVGVTVTVADASGNPVAFAPVTVNVTSDGAGAVAIYSGKAVNAQSVTTFEGLVTNADGEAYFTIQGTEQVLGSTTGSLQSTLSADDAPVKILVSALGADEVAKTGEFKAWFLNMSHLYYAASSPTDWTAPTNSSTDIDLSTPLYSGQRLGGVLADQFNAFDDDDSDKNYHYFATFATDKQPQGSPEMVGIASGMPGYVKYEIIDVSEDAEGNALVEWDTTYCENSTGTATTCVDADAQSGAAVALKPVDDVDLTTLPVYATVKATYVVEIAYGETYEFELKDYTFTKRWTGGYLGIDKYVDQHVLTWQGPAVTLQQSSSTFDAAYTTTVNIIVTNPSNGTLYDVFVRDGVPPEFGVVTGTISDGGTYDAANHTVTWNEDTVAAFEALEPGADPVVLSFDIYARHKPGYCWAEDDAIENYVVDGLDSTIVSGTDDTAWNEHCYDDPYYVTNGDEPRSVLASGWPVADYDINTDQVSFFYTPDEDESDVWVVRPLLELTKTRLTEPVIYTGEVAKFEIEAESVDRTATGKAYESLAAKYPWEFNGALTAGTGHVADDALGTLSEVRNNPYLEDVQVYDAFAVGLDFSKAEDFDGDVYTAGTDNIEGKDLTFALFDLEPGQTKDAEVWLTGNLASTGISGSTVTFFNGADNVQVSDTDGVVSGVDESVYAWNNCAYLTADQLNQPSANTGTIYAVSQSDSAAWYNNEPWTQDEIASQTDAVSITEFVSGSDRQFDVAAAYPALEDCAAVAVVEGPELGINVRGEFYVSGGDITADADLIGAGGALVTMSATDILDPGEDFNYIFSIETNGSMEIENAVFTITLANGTTEFTGIPWVVMSDDDGSTWSSASSLFTKSPSTVDPDGYTLTAASLQPGMQYRIGIAADAESAGTQTTTFTATYDNNVTQVLPLTSTDSTSVSSQ